MPDTDEGKRRMEPISLTPAERVSLFQYVRNVEIENFEEWLNKPIYRIMPLERVLQIYETNELYFPNINKYWEDPYELFVFKQHYVYNGHNLDNNDILQHHYGQCWTSRVNSDAMWRIYSPDLKGVRLKTTPLKLITALLSQKANNMVLNYGAINYLSKDEIEVWLKNNFTGSFADSYVIESFFIKRTNFSHEKEIRFIVSTPTTDGKVMLPALNGVQFQVQPDDVFSQIALDPRLPKDRCDLLKKLLRRYVGAKTKVVQSELYKIKPLTLTIS